MIRYLQLPFHFDAERMCHEVDALAFPWKRHFNEHDYEGTWSGLPLRTPGGRTDSLLTENLQGVTLFEDTPLMRHCPYIQTVLEALQCNKAAVRLLKLHRGSIVREHTDAGLNFERGEARLHIPVRTHPQVAFYLDQERIRMAAGSCWYINASLPHRLNNPSPVDRIHLVVDCLVNGWMAELFHSDDLPKKSVRDASDEQNKMQAQVIAELRLSGDPERLRLADTLEAAIPKTN